MASLLGIFKENTGMFVIEVEEGKNLVRVSCSKKAFDGDQSQLGVLADKIRQSAQSFVIDVDAFQAGYRKVLSTEGSIRSLYSLSELLKRSYNHKDEVDGTRLAEVMERLTTNRQFTKILVNVMNTAEDLEMELGISYR